MHFTINLFFRGTVLLKISHFFTCYFRVSQTRVCTRTEITFSTSITITYKMERVFWKIKQTCNKFSEDNIVFKPILTRVENTPHMIYQRWLCWVYSWIRHWPLLSWLRHKRKKTIGHVMCTWHPGLRKLSHSYFSPLQVYHFSHDTPFQEKSCFPLFLWLLIIPFHNRTLNIIAKFKVFQWLAIFFKHHDIE